MKWLGRDETAGFWNGQFRTDDHGFRSRAIHIDDGKEIWIVFAQETNLDFYKELGNLFLAQYATIDIAVMMIDPMTAIVNHSPEEILIGRSDIVIIDAGFLCRDDRRMQCLHTLVKRPYVILYCDPKHLEKIIAFQEGEMTRWPDLIDMFNWTSIERDRCIQVSAYSVSEARRVHPSVDRIVDQVRQRKIFLCHATEDQEFTRRLAYALYKKGMVVWYDRWAMQVGDSIADKINAGIRESRFMGVVLSENSVKKPWCNREINAALMRQIEKQGIELLPIMLEDCSVPPLLADLYYADFRRDFDEGFSQLVRAIESKARHASSSSK